MLRQIKDFCRCAAPLLQALLWVALFMAVVIGVLFTVAGLSGCVSSGGIEQPPAMQYSLTSPSNTREL